MASTTPPKAPVRTAFVASARSASIKSTATTGSNASGVGVGLSGSALGLNALNVSNSSGSGGAGFGVGGLGLSGRVAFEPPTPATPSAGSLNMLYVTSVAPMYSLNDYVAPLRKGAASGSGSGTGAGTVNSTANSTVGTNGIGSVEDRIQFARTLRPESSEFMGLWMYAHTHGAGAALVFYKEAVLLLDALAAATPAPNNDRFVAERFSAARLVGLTPPVARFLFASGNNNSNGNNSSSYIIPPIPPTLIPPSLRYPFESLINSHVLASSSSSSPPLPGVSLKSRNALFQLVSSNAPLPSSVLDDVLDELLVAMFEGVYAQYIRDIGEYQHNLQLLENPSANTLADRTRAASSNSSYKQKNDDETSSIHQKTPAKTDRRTSAAQQSLAGDDSSPTSKKDSTPSPNLKSPEESLHQQQQFQQPPQPVLMLYSKVANDNNRELNRVMEFAGFKDRKDSDKLLLEFSRACFVKIMDKNSSSYRDFSQYAKTNKFQNHINFYEQICKFDDMVACITPTIDATLVKTYSRARNEFGITQPISRFIKYTQDPDPTYQRLQRLPSLPSIPCVPVPDTLKTTVIDIYGTFIGRDSRQEITFSPTRRPAVQSALQQDFLRPIETDLLDGCADEVVDTLYEHCFKKYVMDNGGSMTPKSEFAGLSTFTTAAGSVTSASSVSMSTGPAKKMNLKKPGVNGEGFFAGFFNKPKQSSVVLHRSASTSTGSLQKSNNSGAPGHAAVSVSAVALPQSTVQIEMLYEIQPKKELTTQYLEVSKTRSSFLNAMRLDGLLFKQLVQFASSNRAEFKSFQTVCEDGSDIDPSAGNLKFYQAICNLEDQVASITPSENPEDAIFYRSARADGLNQSLNRFLIQSDAIDLTISTLPAIPAHPVPTRLRSQFINIYTTYISETAPVDVSISTVKRVSVQLAIQQENINPLMTNIFDDCIDEVLQNLYEQTFMRFVTRKSVASVGTGLSLQPLNGLTANTVSTVAGEINVSTFSRKFTETASRSDSPLVDSPISNVNSPLLLSPFSPISQKSPPAPFAPSNRSLKGKARSGKGSDSVLLI
ncbi:hypothetical protein HK100_003569 [Physocladia obscura]|uniref:RGS domain-containing protein n=1 Tax=Physocladia obscura TaxID=109957 RepID=A0AAD5SW24_9FUNG|nr:hypothetical protein HK100_003569 [Physocladia obscura]